MLEIVTLLLAAIVLFIAAIVLRLTNSVARLELAALPDFFPEGRAIPRFTARALVGAKRVALPGTKPSILVFLAPGCPACRHTLPEVESLSESLDGDSPTLWVIGEGAPSHVRRMLSVSLLARNTLLLGKGARRVLNPSVQVPSYIMVDETSRAVASGSIGDANWQSVHSQLQDERQSP